MYEGLYHEVHNEPERETMFKDLEAWLQTRV
jgi:alpha-beta hydrolase superfamily lysophospholipase